MSEKGGKGGLDRDDDEHFNERLREQEAQREEIDDDESAEVCEPDVAVVRCSPVLTPKMLLDSVQTGKHPADVVVLITGPNGDLPEASMFFTNDLPRKSLDSSIKKLVDMEIPVFLLSGGGHGILDDGKSDSLRRALEAGAISLKNVNVDNLKGVVDFINEQIRNGQKGRGLGTVVRIHYYTVGAVGN